MGGYLFQKLVNKNHMMSSETLKKLAIFLQKLGMIWFTSITYIGSLWIFRINSISELMSLPFVGIVSIFTGAIFTFFLSKYGHYNRTDTGSLFSCGFFSNAVSLGSLIVFFYLGEEGFALTPILTFLHRAVYYGIGFPIVRMYGNNLNHREKIFGILSAIIKDPFFNIGVGAVLIGLILNRSSLMRPNVYTAVNEILIPLSTFVLLFSVGLNLRFSRISQYPKECFCISLIKFIAAPIVTLIVAFLAGYQTIDNGLPLKVSVIMASMPVAFNSVVAANIYNLNIDLVNSCWIFTTFGVLFILPFLLMFLNIL
jgi:predicted permease